MFLKEFHQEADDFISFIRPVSSPAKVIWDTASLHPSSPHSSTRRAGLSSSCFPRPAQVLVCTLLIRWARGQAAALGRLPFLMP